MATGRMSMKGMSVTTINLTRISPQNRLLMWILLLLLSAALLLFPVNMVYQYHAIQAPYIFDNLPLFGAIFCVWVFLLLLMLFSREEKGDTVDWHNLMLACVFGLVFIGFWVVITPHGSYGDDMSNMGIVRWLMQHGSILVGSENLAYFEFPGMHLLVSAVCMSTGLGVFEGRMLFMLFNAALFSGLFYLFAVRILKSNRLACFATIVVLMGSVIIISRMRIFAPAAFGYTLLAGFLLMLTRSETKLLGETLFDRLVLLVLFSVIVGAYLPISLLIPLILVGIYAIYVIRRNNASRPSIVMICLFLVMVLAWEVFWSWHTFKYSAGFLPSLWNQLVSLGFVKTALTMGSANVGGALPLWANLVRLFWWAVLGIGTIVGLCNLFRIKRLSLADQVVTGGLLGVVMETVIGMVAVWGGYQFQRFLLYAPLVCIPILLLFMSRSGTLGKIGLALLAVLVFALAVPSFLSSVNQVATDAIYPHEIAAGQFLESHSQNEGGSLTVYSYDPTSVAWLDYYAPNARPQRVEERTAYEASIDEIWQALDGLAADFAVENPGLSRQRIFAVGEKSTEGYQHLRGILSNDPHWEKLNEVLSGTNRIYDDGHLQMYASRA
jgi:hypothetical protein